MIISKSAPMINRKIITKEKNCQNKAHTYQQNIKVHHSNNNVCYTPENRTRNKKQLPNKSSSDI